VGPATYNNMDGTIIIIIIIILLFKAFPIVAHKITSLLLIKCKDIPVTGRGGL
jgi:hypothetical protein